MGAGAGASAGAVDTHNARKNDSTAARGEQSLRKGAEDESPSNNNNTGDSDDGDSDDGDGDGDGEHESGNSSESESNDSASGGGGRASKKQRVEPPPSSSRETEYRNMNDRALRREWNSRDSLTDIHGAKMAYSRDGELTIQRLLHNDRA